MNKSIEKFTMFLENKRVDLIIELGIYSKETLTKFYKENHSLTLSNTISLNYLKSQKQFNKLTERIDVIDHFLEMSKLFDNNDKQNLIFCDFSLLSNFLYISDLNNKDKANVIFYYVNNNIKINLLSDINESTIMYKSDIKFLEVDGVSKELINKISKSNNNLSKFLLKDEEELTEEEKKLKDAIYKYAEEHSESKAAMNIKKQTKILKENYFDKINSFDQEDVKIIINSLKELGINIYILEDVKQYLEARAKSNSTKKTNTIKYTPFTQEKQTLNNSVSLEEEKEYRRELKSLFNFDKMERVKEELTFDEIIRCAALALYFGYEKSKIKMFFFEMRVRPFYVYEYDDLTEIYDKFKSQIEFYKDKCDLYDEVEMLDEIVSYLKENYDGDWNNELSKKLFSISKKLKNNFANAPYPDSNKPDKYIDHYQYEFYLANQIKEKLEKKNNKGKSYKLVKNE